MDIARMSSRGPAATNHAYREFGRCRWVVQRQLGLGTETGSVHRHWRESLSDGPAPRAQRAQEEPSAVDGLYRAANGRRINADVNGSYNILRNVLPDAFGQGTAAPRFAPYGFPYARSA